MAVAQLKNLQRRLQLLSDEAEQGLNRVCGHELWKSVGPDAVDSVTDPDRRAEANYWYGQWNVVRELQRRSADDGIVLFVSSAPVAGSNPGGGSPLRGCCPRAGSLPLPWSALTLPCSR